MAVYLIEKKLRENVSKDELFDLIMDNNGKLQVGEDSYVFLLKVNDTNFKMPDSLKQQLINEGKYDRSWICVYTSFAKDTPLSYENLPVYGSSSEWVTKWFKRTPQEAYNDELKNIDLVTKYNLYTDPAQDFEYRRFSFDIYTDSMPGQQTLFVYKNHAPEGFGSKEYREIKKYIREKYNEEIFNYEDSYYDITPYSNKKLLTDFKKNSKLGGYYIPYDNYQEHIDAYIEKVEGPGYRYEG